MVQRYGFYLRIGRIQAAIKTGSNKAAGFDFKKTYCFSASTKNILLLLLINHQFLC